MGNRLRFRSGQVQLVKVPVDSASVIEAGDLVFLDSGEVKSAADFAWDTDLATTQGAFAEVFLGVAHQGSEAGEAEPVSVDVSPFSVYEFDVQSAAYGFGDVLGPDELSSGLMNQQLEVVGSSANGIARAMETRSGGSLRVSFASAFHAGSANAAAGVG